MAFRISMSSEDSTRICWNADFNCVFCYFLYGQHFMPLSFCALLHFSPKLWQPKTAHLSLTLHLNFPHVIQSRDSPLYKDSGLDIITQLVWTPPFSLQNLTFPPFALGSKWITQRLTYLSCKRWKPPSHLGFVGFLQDKLKQQQKQRYSVAGGMESVKRNQPIRRLVCDSPVLEWFLFRKFWQEMMIPLWFDWMVHTVISKLCWTNRGRRPTVAGAVWNGQQSDQIGFVSYLSNDSNQYLPIIQNCHETCSQRISENPWNIYFGCLPTCLNSWTTMTLI